MASAVATTSSPPTFPPATGSARHSTSARWLSGSRSFSSARSVSALSANGTGAAGQCATARNRQKGR